MPRDTQRVEHVLAYPMQDLLGDSNPMVVANALCALTEIKENASFEVVRFTPALLFKLLRALNECTEWGQVRELSLGFRPPLMFCEGCVWSSMSCCRVEQLLCSISFSVPGYMRLMPC
jgi:non-SMC mitotic condensation complex subunit 1